MVITANFVVCICLIWMYSPTHMIVKERQRLFTSRGIKPLSVWEKSTLKIYIFIAIHLGADVRCQGMTQAGELLFKGNNLLPK